MTGNSFYSVEKVPDGRSGGTTQAETRIYNERLIVSLVRRHGQLSKADLTRLTGLAAQTITTIVNRAADGQLLLRREPLRGRLGQPSVPYALNPAGGPFVRPQGRSPQRRRRAGRLRRQRHRLRADDLRLSDAERDHGLCEIGHRPHVPQAQIDSRRSASPASGSPRPSISGTGTRTSAYRPAASMPGSRSTFAPSSTGFSTGRSISSTMPWCRAGAELMFGSGLGRADFLYAYIGYYLGGGLVLDHHLFPGRNKLAGAIGEIPVPAAGRDRDGAMPLMQNASSAVAGRQARRRRRRPYLVVARGLGRSRRPAGRMDRRRVRRAGLCCPERGGAARHRQCRSSTAPFRLQVRREIAKATRRKLARVTRSIAPSRSP